MNFTTRRSTRSEPVALQGISYAYPSTSRAVTVLRDVSLEVAAGEWVAIMGPSGSGKSTLLMCAAGLLRAATGSIELDGEDLAECSESRLAQMRRGRVGFVFQDFNLVPALTAAQNVGLPGLFGGPPRPKRQVLDALRSVGLDGKGNSRPDQLSGGQQQRVAIARALVASPAVVFADEPTGSLDARSGDQVLDLFGVLVEAGSAVLMVTHDPRVAARAARVVWLSDGRIVAEMRGATAAEIATRLASLEAETR